ncbi:MAG: phosphatidate cytidylyltransferase [Pseudorhodoplanes sp.]
MAEPLSAPEPVGVSRHNMVLRIASAVVLAPLAIAAAYFGGFVFVAFWTAAAIGILWEWMRLVETAQTLPPFLVGTGALCVCAFLLGMDYPSVAMIAVALGALGAAAIARFGKPIWIAGGVFYAGAILIALVFLRDDPQFGFLAIMLLFAVVWTTDILGYFAGRALGGPKLAPAISPKKTWSGSIVGLAGAVAAALLVARGFGSGHALYIAAIAFVLSVASQAGDLFESRIKRFFDTKDTGNLVPGHGGLMDRLDGFWAAAVVAALIGAAVGGLDTPARGLIGW